MKERFSNEYFRRFELIFRSGLNENDILSGQLNYGIVFLLSLRRHPPCVVSKNQYRVDYFLSYCKYHVIVNRFLILWFLIF